MVLSDNQNIHSNANSRSDLELGKRVSDARVNSGIGLKRSIFAPLLKLAYRVLNCARRCRIGNVLIDIICRLEGGAMFSQTARELLSKYHEVDIGPYTYGPCFIPGYLPPQVSIGNYTSIADGVRVVNENHPMTKLSTHPLLYGDLSERVLLEIGHDVWLGFNVVILPGCHRIGTGAIVGAGSIVTKDIPPYAIAVGNPARILRYRFPEEVCAKLLASQWWTRDCQAADAAQQRLGKDIVNALIGEGAEVL